MTLTMSRSELESIRSVLNNVVVRDADGIEVLAYSQLFTVIQGTIDNTCDREGYTFNGKFKVPVRTMMALEQAVASLSYEQRQQLWEVACDGEWPTEKEID